MAKLLFHLGKVLYRVYVMMWGWRDKTDTRNGMTQMCDLRGHLISGQLAAFARLCTLRHLDLQHLCVCQIRAAHTKAGRGHLQQNVDEQTLIVSL